MPKRKPSLFSAIISRQIRGGNVHRDLSMIRILIESDQREFKKVWEKSSKSPIVYAGDLFFDAYTTCYDLMGFVDEPRLLYRLPKLPKRRKIEQLLVCEFPLDQTSFTHVKRTECGPNGPYSIGLTADNYLKTFDYKSGGTLQAIYLSSQHKFMYLSWETDLERILIKSTRKSSTAPVNSMLRLPRDERAAETLLYLAVMSVSPLRFLCVLPISKSIFGADMCNASIRDGLLTVMHLKGKINFYNFEEILKNMVPLNLGDRIECGNTLDLPEVDEFGCGTVGSFPIGLPVNICLSAKPCVLFQIVSDNHEVSFGGFPWHYISSEKDLFHIKSVKDGNLAENGTLESKCHYLCIEFPKAYFHADLSGHILHVESPILRCLKLSTESFCDGVAKCSLSEQFSLDFGSPKQAPSQGYVQTKSGRRVKNLFDSYHGNILCEPILDVDYDDELDVLAVLYLETLKKGASVAFFDNQTGQIVHKFGLGEISEEEEHSIAIDRNTLVIISRIENSFNCAFYALHSKP